MAATNESDTDIVAKSASPTSAMSTASSADLAEMGKVMVEDGDGEEAIRLFREALYKAEMDSSHSNDPTIAKALVQLASALREASKHEEALALSQRAVEIYKTTSDGLNQEDAADAQCGVAYGLINTEHYDAGVKTFKQALGTIQKVKGRRDAKTAEYLHELADVVYFKGAEGTATTKLQRDVVEMMRACGEADMDAGDILNNMAMSMLNDGGNFDGAFEAFQEVLEIEKEQLGEHDEKMAITLNNMAMIKRKKGDYDESIDLYMEALFIRRKALGRKHPSVAVTLTNMAAVWYYEGDYEMATKLYTEALEIRKHNEMWAEAADTLNNMAIVSDFSGKWEVAVKQYDQAYEILCKSLGAGHPNAAYIMCGKAMVLMQEGAFEPAMELFKKALQVYEAALGRNHPYTADAISGMGQVMYKRRDYDAAMVLFKDALTIRKIALGLMHPATYKSIMWVAETRRRANSMVTNIPEGYEVVFDDEEEDADAAPSNNNDAAKSNNESAGAAASAAAAPSADGANKTAAAASASASKSGPASPSPDPESVGVFRAKAAEILTVSTAKPAEPAPEKKGFFQRLWAKSPFAKKKKKSKNNSPRNKMQDAKALDARLNGS